MTMYSRRLTALSVCILLFAAAGYGETAKRGARHCQIMDAQPDYIYNVSMGYCTASKVYDNEVQVANGDKADAIELNADWDIAYLHSVLRGDMALALLVRSTVFPETLNGLLPNQVLRAGLDCAWSWRYKNDVSLRVRVIPGLYTDMDADFNDSVNVPVSCEVVKAFGSELSGVVGLQYRHGFNRDYMPLVGIVWEPDQALRIDLRCPDSRLTCYMVGGWSTHLGIEWDDWTYAFDSADPSFDKISFDSYRAYWGIVAPVAEKARLTVDVGTLFSREIRYGSDSERELDISNSLFLRFGLGAPF